MYGQRVEIQFFAAGHFMGRSSMLYALAMLLLFGCYADAVLLLCCCYAIACCKTNQARVRMILVKVVIWKCQNCDMDWIKLLHWFVKNKSCYMDLYKLSLWCVKVVLCIARPLPNKTKLKLDNNFKACWCWSFCHELKVLNESKYSMPWARCAFGNVSL